MKITIDEKVSVWKRYRLTFPEDSDASTKEKLKDLIEHGMYDNIECIQVYPETEDHIEYDFDTVEIEE